MPDANHIGLNQLTRRDFLRLCGASSIGLALAACGVTPTPIPTVAPTNTSSPTNTPLPTNTQLPTATQTLTNTPAPTSTATLTVTPTATATPRVLTLRDYADAIGFNIGNAEARADTPQVKVMNPQYFNLVNFAAELEWSRAEPTRGNIIFTNPRRGVDAEGNANYALAHGMKIMGTPLVYYEAYPDWLTKGNFSRDEAIAIIKNFVGTVVSHFKGKIKIWIPVNEFYPISWGNTRDTLQNIIGEEYVDIAFQTARESDPSAKLIVNYPRNESPSPETNLTKRIADRLKAKGILDGVGLEMHLEGSAPPNKQEVIQTMRNYGMPVYVTEFDVNMRGVAGTQEERFAKQAKIYKEMLEAALESGVCDTFSVFGIGDKWSWLEVDPKQKRYSPDADPTPFDDNFQPKPAYFAMLQVFQGYYEKQKPK